MVSSRVVTHQLSPVIAAVLKHRLKRGSFFLQLVSHLAHTHTYFVPVLLAMPAAPVRCRLYSLPACLQSCCSQLAMLLFLQKLHIFQYNALQYCRLIPYKCIQDMNQLAMLLYVLGRGWMLIDLLHAMAISICMACYIPTPFAWQSGIPNTPWDDDAVPCMLQFCAWLLHSCM